MYLLKKFFKNLSLWQAWAKDGQKQEEEEREEWFEKKEEGEIKGEVVWIRKMHIAGGIFRCQSEEVETSYKQVSPEFCIESIYPLNEEKNRIKRGK